MVPGLPQSRHRASRSPPEHRLVDGVEVPGTGAEASASLFAVAAVLDEYAGHFLRRMPMLIS
jgi:hypothetical protein